MEIPIWNPIYLMLVAFFGSAAKGTGLKALQFALSICDTVDMYGFTVDLGQGISRSLEKVILHCRLVKIHSLMRSDPNCVVKWVPDCGTISAARIASDKLLRFAKGNLASPVLQQGILILPVYQQGGFLFLLL
ncbi:Sialyltransferase-like protein 2 [Camellia lanceoleosa]|uniref:Sialyltransferase-like protein 2 n=1 Tax=Camellia lanceoleosa TaxID=1840588 RepID=A0ACC0J6W4_9ERIC|nr:Sialyltransferase-like protein 2 [Camellia lanceoleosa]